MKARLQKTTTHERNFYAAAGRQEVLTRAARSSPRRTPKECILKKINIDIKDNDVVKSSSSRAGLRQEASRGGGGGGGFGGRSFNSPCGAAEELPGARSRRQTELCVCACVCARHTPFLSDHFIFFEAEQILWINSPSGREYFQHHSHARTHTHWFIFCTACLSWVLICHPVFNDACRKDGL